MRVSDDVMKVLGSAEVVGSHLYMGHLGALDRERPLVRPDQHSMPRVQRHRIDLG